MSIFSNFTPIGYNLEKRKLCCLFLMSGKGKGKGFGPIFGDLRF